MPVVLLSLSEPDKRISHTSGSPAGHSVCLRPTTRVQVFADSHGGPSYIGECLQIGGPGVCRTLTFAVKPSKQDAFHAVDIEMTPCGVIRYGVVVQIPCNTGPSMP